MKGSTGRDAGIQVRAEYLRGGEPAGHANAFTPADVMPLDMRSSGSSHKRRSWRSHDLQRALAAARKAGLERYRVEIAPDGTIAIVVGFETGRARR